jgi:hypothetical protein
LVTMDENLLYYYDPETKQKSMEWRHSGSFHLAPKTSECKIPLEKFSTRFLWSRRHPPHWLYSKGPNYHLLVQLKDFKGKTQREGHQGDLVLARQCPGSPGTYNLEETGQPGLPTPWSSTLISGSGPVGLPPVPWTDKNNWKLAIFRLTRRSLLPRTLGWKNFWIFFKFLQKLEQRAKKCIELRERYVVQIPS